MSSLLVGLLLVASLRSVGSVWRARRAAAERTDRTVLAEALMQEIMGRPIVDPQVGVTVPFGVDTNESAASRLDFDDADDFDNWTATPPQRRDGTPRTEFGGWTRSALVEHLDGGDPNTVVSDGTSEQGVRRITVTVTDAEGNSTSLVAVRGLLGDTGRAPHASRTNAKAVDLVLRVGNGPAIRSSTDVRSEAFDQ